MRPLIPALLALLSSSTHAFYPYHRNEPTQNSPRAVSKPRSPPKSEDEDAPILTLPLYKTKRANNFPIVLAANPGQTTSLGIHQDGNDHSYFCSFKVGTSQKDFHLLLDSAASNTWLMSAECRTNACNVHTTLASSDSSTLTRDVASTFSVTYGTGSVKGLTGTDMVHFGGMNVSLTFGLATDVSDEFADFPMDGILGLGRQENIVDKTGMIDAPALMDVLVSTGTIQSKLYALDLWRASDGGANTGAMNFGQVDTQRFEGNINYINAVKNDLGFWEIPVADAGVNGNKAGLGFPQRTAIIDSGTSYILMPRDDAVQLHELIRGYTFDGSETFTVPCDSVAKVQFTFGGVTYEVQPDDYIGTKQANGGCASNIIGRQTFGARQWLVGDVFLKNVYTVFDFDAQRVGFGLKPAKSIQPSSSTTGELLNPDADVNVVFSSTSASEFFPSPTTTLSTSTSTVIKVAETTIDIAKWFTSMSTSTSTRSFPAYIVPDAFDLPHTLVFPTANLPSHTQTEMQTASQTDTDTPTSTKQAEEPVITPHIPFVVSTTTVMESQESPLQDASTTATNSPQEQQDATFINQSTLLTTPSFTARASGTGTGMLLPPGATTLSNPSAGLPGATGTESTLASASADASNSAMSGPSLSRLWLVGLLGGMFWFR